MSFERNNLWAPWRMKYIQAIEKDGRCFMCENRDTPDNDADNYVLWRTELSIVVFNRFPYNNGHLLVAPNRHIPDMESASDEEIFDIVCLTRDLQILLRKAINCHGFNIGANIGRCAGAGLPGHLHIHIVPRWDGDTGYMSVCSDIDVISQSLDELYAQLTSLSKEMSLPRVR